MRNAGMICGYARLSTVVQGVDAQVRRANRNATKKVFRATLTGA
jgi:hypothetical protein